MKNDTNTYLARGVSPTKEDVQEAIKSHDAGLFPGAFCKIIEDTYGDENYCTAMHADGAGTKSILAYIHYKETGDASVFKGIAQDSIVMNTDDLICAGFVNNLVLSNTIGRNAHRIGGDILKELIQGYKDFTDTMKKYGVNILLAGGETADVGDLVSTIIVDSTIYTRELRKNIIDCSNIKPGCVVVGLASFGQAIYEDKYNSGIASNGFTAARHTLLSSEYIKKYPETYSSTMRKDQIYQGKFKMEDKVEGMTQTIGEALLSPTRTYIPVIAEILNSGINSITGIIQSSGGGQVKCKNFGKNLHYIKDNLFDPPAIFKLIEKEGDMTPKEMYLVFNMGQRMEIYLSKGDADKVISISKKYGIDAQIIGRVEKNENGNKVTIKRGEITFEY